MFAEKDIYEAIKLLKSGFPMSDEMLEVCKRDPNKAIQVAIARGARWKEAEPYIIDSAINSSPDWSFSRNLVSYCSHVVGGRWAELEDAYKSNPECVDRNTQLVRDYASNVIRGRWSAVEPYINSPSQIKDYAYHVIKGRWPEKEKELLKDINASLDYCLYNIKERWKDLEDKILELPDCSQKNSKIISYCVYFGRWKEAEDSISSPSAALDYALYVIKGRWKEKEPIIANDPGLALRYAQEVIKGPFPEAEENILKSEWYFEYFTFATSASRALASQLASQFPSDMTIGEVLKLIDNGRNPEFEKKLLSSTHNQGKAVWYAVNVLKSRWPEMEEKIKKSAKCAVLYARDVIKGRWEDAEKYVSKNDKYLSQYGIEVVKGRLPDVLHNKMIASAMRDSKNKHVKSYFNMLEQNG